MRNLQSPLFCLEGFDAISKHNGDMSVLLQSFPNVVFQVCLRGGMNKVHFATKDVQIRDSGKVVNNMLFKVFESVMLGDVCGHFDFFARQRSEQQATVHGSFTLLRCTRARGTSRRHRKISLRWISLSTNSLEPA